MASAMRQLSRTRSSSETVQRARAILQHHAKTFRLASAFLSSEQRDDAAIAYAFCRLVDDAVDEAEDTPTAEQQLKELEQALYSGEGDAIVVAYRELAERAGFGLEPARDLIEGARSDLGQVRLQNDEDLQTYCYRVAGTVGLMMCGILGVRDPAARRHAIDLGIGMQLTNICRDVLEDAERGRVYLPADRLLKAGVSSVELLSAVRIPASSAQFDTSRVSKAVARVVQQLLSQADFKYASGANGFRFLPTRARLAIQVASHLYRNIGVSLRRERSCNSLLGRVSLSPVRKGLLMLQALGAWFFGLCTQRQAPPPLPPHLTTSA